MADKQVRIDLTAEDHASAKVDDVAEAVEQLEKADPTVEVAADTTSATAALQGLTADAKAVGEAAPVLDVKSDVTQATEDLKKLRAGSDEADEGIKNVHDSSDQSRSVLANMVGNTSQELGELGGVAGTAGVALGQLGEYAADGNISLQGLASMAGPMAGLFLASQALSKVMGIFADRAKQAEEDTQAWGKAMDGSGDAASNMAAGLAEAGKVMGDTSDHQITFARVAGETTRAVTELGGPLKGLIDLFRDSSPVKDITDLLADAGITVDQWTTSVAGGATGAEAFQAAIAATSLSAGEQDDLMNALTNSQGAYETAARNAAAATKVFGGRIDETAVAAAQLEAAHAELARAVGVDVDRMNAKWDELRGGLDADEAVLNLQTEFDALKVKGTEAFDAAQAGAADAEQKQRDYETAIIDAKRSVIDLGTQIGLSLDRTTTLVTKVDKGELDAVENQIEILRRNNKINLEIVAKSGAGYGAIAGPQAGPRALPPEPAPAVVNINMPTGARGVDVVRQVAGQTRRNGRRYGATPVVNFARR